MRSWDWFLVIRDAYVARTKHFRPGGNVLYNTCQCLGSMLLWFCRLLAINSISSYGKWIVCLMHTFQAYQISFAGLGACILFPLIEFLSSPASQFCCIYDLYLCLLLLFGGHYYFLDLEF